MGQVLDAKNKIKEIKGYETHLQTVIFAGKVLETDSKALADYGVTEKSSLVVTVKRVKAPKPAPAPAAPTPAAPTAASAATSGTPVTPAVNASSMNTPPAAPQHPTGPPPAIGTTPVSSDPSMVAGEDLQAAVVRITEMGFPEADVRLALRAAFNNPDRAVEYLMTSIPDIQDAAPTPVAAPSATRIITSSADGANPNPVDISAADADGDGGISAQGALQELASDPSFQQLRQAVQAQPQLLPIILSQLAENRPEMFDLILQNQQEFMQLLGLGGEEGDEPMSGGEGANPLLASLGIPTVQLTPEDNESIERLVSMGFSRDSAIEAFLLCDKNEANAANYLLDSMDQM